MILTLVIAAIVPVVFYFIGSATANFDNNTNSNSGFIASWYQASSGHPTTNALTRLGAGL